MQRSKRAGAPGQRILCLSGRGSLYRYRRANVRRINVPCLPHISMMHAK